MDINEIEKLFGRSSTTELAALKATLETEKLKSRISTIPDIVEEQVLRMQAEQKAYRDQLLVGVIPKNASEYLTDRVGSARTIADSIRFLDKDTREMLLGRPAHDMDKFAARIGIVGTAAESLRIQSEAFRRQLVASTVFDQAYELAQAAQQFHLDDYLDSFRTSVGPLTDKMLYLNSLDSIRSEERLRSFVQASTVADILGNSLGYGSEAQQALESLARQTIPQFDTVQEYGHMLKAAGIALPHWPHPRLLTIGERRKRLRQKMNAGPDSRHAKKAWTVFQRYELILREIIDDVMTEHYGEDWPHERLAKCGCQTLLGRWNKRGGNLFDHADFAQYIAIMCDEEHFEAVFSSGFEDRDGLRDLLTKAKDLRAAVMHFHAFTKENLRDVRTTWTAIESGLLGLTSEYELVYH